MPRYRKKRYYKKRRYKKSGWGGWMSLAKRAMKTALYVKSLINVEKKAYDLSAQTPVTSSTGSITNLAPITQDDTITGRDGNTIKLKSVYFKAVLLRHDSSTSTYFRMCIFIDRANNDNTTPTITDILDTSSYLSALNLNNRKRFLVLFDKLVTLDSLTKKTKAFNIYKKLDFKTVFADNSAIPSSNGLYLLCLSSESSYAPSLVFTSRVRFLDN